MAASSHSGQSREPSSPLPPRAGWAARPGVRPALIAFGWINVGLGTAGVFIPGLPTTVFLIVALWAFSKSSERFHRWLYSHPRFGPPVREWSEHGVVPPRAKFLATTVMAASWVLLTLVVASDWRLPGLVGAVMVAVAAFILTRPSHARR